MFITGIYHHYNRSSRYLNLPSPEIERFDRSKGKQRPIQKQQKMHLQIDRLSAAGIDFIREINYFKQ